MWPFKKNFQRYQPISRGDIEEFVRREVSRQLQVELSLAPVAVPVIGAFDEPLIGTGDSTLMFAVRRAVSEHFAATKASKTAARPTPGMRGAKRGKR
jgi:hypothetical protein